MTLRDRLFWGASFGGKMPSPDHPNCRCVLYTATPITTHKIIGVLAKRPKAWFTPLKVVWGLGIRTQRWTFERTKELLGRLERHGYIDMRQRSPAFLGYEYRVKPSALLLLDLTSKRSKKRPRRQEQTQSPTPPH